MVKITKVKSGSIFETKESYSRIVAVDNWIFVSNTAGRNYRTREMSDDPVEQARQCFHNIEGALKSGQEVKIIGFGNFSVAKRAASTGRNPRTGETIKIAASKTPKFKAGKGLKDAVNR